jgi:hypothetical protein
MPRIRVTASRKAWRDFMDVVFSAHDFVHVYFDPDMVVAYGLTPDHMKFYDVEIHYGFFFRYDVEEVEDPVVFRIDRRDFYKALRELKEEMLELWYDEKAGVLKLGSSGSPEKGRVVGEVETYEVEEMGVRKKVTMTRRKLPPMPKIDFVNKAVIFGLQDFVALKRYVGYTKLILITFEWSDWELSVRVGTEDGSIIVEVPKENIYIHEHKTDTWASYDLDLIDLPTVGNPPVEVEMAAGEQMPIKFTVKGDQYTFTLYVAPHFDIRVPKLPVFKEYARFPPEAIEPLKYFVKLLDERIIRDNVLKPKGGAFEFLGIDASHVLLLHARLKPYELFITENIVLTPYLVELTFRVCEIQHNIIMGVEEGGTVRLCGIPFGVVATPEYKNMIDTLEDVYKKIDAIFEQYAGRYAYIEVWGDKLAKAIEKAETIRMAVWPDRRAVVEIDGVRWSEKDLVEVRPAPTFTGTSVSAKSIPVLPAVTVLRKVPIKIYFYGLKPVVFDYEVSTDISIKGYVGAYVDDFDSWASKMGFLKPLTEDDVLSVIRERPGLNHIELSEELVSRGISPLDLASMVKKLSDRGLIVKKDGRYYPVEKAPPPVEAERKKVQEDVEKLREEISKTTPEAEKLLKDVDEVAEHLLPFVTTARKYLDDLDKIGRLPDVEFDKRIREVERLVADVEGFLRKFDEDKATIRLDERLSSIRRRFEELKAKNEEFTRRAEELRSRVARVGLPREIAEAQPLGLTTFGEYVVNRIPYRLETIDKDLELIESLRNVLEFTKRRLEERRRALAPSKPPVEVRPPAKPPEIKPPVEVKPPPPPAPPAVPKTFEEARPVQKAVEDFLAARVKPPRPEITKPIVRVDWHDATYGWLGARISYHREVEGQLFKALEEAGCRVERVVEAKPPLKIAYVDCRGARVPVVAPPPAPPKPAPPPFDPERRWRELVERARQLVEEWVTLYVPKAKQEVVRAGFQRSVREAEGPALADAKSAVETGKPELAVRVLEEAVDRVLRDTARVVVSVAPKAREHPEIVRLLGPPPAPPAPPAPVVPEVAPPEMPLERIAFGPKPPGVSPEIWKWAKWLARLESFAARRGPPAVSDLAIKFARVYGHRNPLIEVFPPMSSVEDDRVVLALRTVEGLARIGEMVGLKVGVKSEWDRGELLRLLDDIYRRGDERVREWVDELRGQIRGG